MHKFDLLLGTISATSNVISVGNSINIVKDVSIKYYDEIAINIAKLFAKCNITMLVTNRDKIIFNNSNITDIDVSSLIDLSLIELIDKKSEFCSNCDIRPIIIDSNVEGIVIILNSNCNELVGELYNILVTYKLDITC